MLAILQIEFLCHNEISFLNNFISSAHVFPRFNTLRESSLKIPLYYCFHVNLNKKVKFSLMMIFRDDEIKLVNFLHHTNFCIVLEKQRLRQRDRGSLKRTVIDH